MADLFDRTLDKGIVIDAYVRLSRERIGLVAVDRRIVIATVTVHLSDTDAHPTA